MLASISGGLEKIYLGEEENLNTEILFGERKQWLLSANETASALFSHLRKYGFRENHLGLGNVGANRRPARRPLSA